MSDTLTSACPYGGEVTKEQTRQLRKDFDTHEIQQNTTLQDIYEQLREFSNRLPPWGTLVISLLCTALGICIGIIGMLIKFS